MLHKDTLIPTARYGALPIKNILIGMVVRTSEGWCKVINHWCKNKSYMRKYKIETSIGSVIFDERQHFFQDDKRIGVFRLHTGSFIDTLYGPKKIIKMTRAIDNYTKYCDIRVNNLNSNFFINNGIKVCY